MQGPLPQQWDLERFFSGGSGSTAFHEYLADLTRTVDRLCRWMTSIPVPSAPDALGDWPELIAAWQDGQARLQEALSFTRCLTAQDTADAQARTLAGRVRQLAASLEAGLAGLDGKLSAMSEPVWSALLAHPAVSPVAFGLGERRRLAREKLPPDKEALGVELAVDGYHGWNELYTLVAGRIRVPFEVDGRPAALSVGQAAQRLTDPDPRQRARLADAFEEAWAREAEIFAAALNHLAGFRLTLYRHRGWDSVLHEPLARNRMRPETLEAMWAAVRQGQERLLPYFEWKARLLGLEGLGWFDVGAPVGSAGRRPIAYDDAARFIVDRFRDVSPRLAALAGKAFAQSWIEAEDRPGKDAGGFCTSFPLRGESRIFLTYGGRPQGVDTLAHELGHAYHFAVVKDLPPLARLYPMNLAETASTLAEMIVSDAALAAAADDEVRLGLLDSRLQRTVAFLMNIHARFLFELDFYGARKHGPLTVEELNGLMDRAQRTAYRDALIRYHPLFWASKLHFYLTATPFYNFPYTLGFLFSALLYARAKTLGVRFDEVCHALLRDTGRRVTEDLAREHLGVDLTRQEAWDEAVALVTADVDRFVALARRSLG